MSKKIIFVSILLFSLIISNSSQECYSHKNNCEQCHPLTNLCSVCEKTIYKPNEEGGCDLSHQCIQGENYCIECNNNDDLCSECELGFFPDENGGCSSTDNCIVSENGKCLQCKDYFYLIEGSYTNFCKYKFSDDFRNCAEVNLNTGKCLNCEKGFFMSREYNKCLNTDNCQKSKFGICTKCYYPFFLDKNDDLCKKGENQFSHCKISLDGKICSECNDGYFLSEDGLCSKSQNCKKVNNNSDCIKCSEGYFLIESENLCTMEKNCKSANSQYGICEICKDSFYIENESRKCFSNIDGEFKFCTKVSSGNCSSCENGYRLSQNKKCSSSKNCLESKNGICIKCEENYNLGLDNNCINIEKCIYSLNGECLECENNYYFDSYKLQCLQEINQYKNCKRKNIYDEYCDECKNDFYFSKPDKMCYNNTEEGALYKCAFSTQNGKKCSKCINNYFLGIKDLKCSKIKNCAISENENKCVECDKNLCLDVKKQICVNNYNGPENEEQKIYFNCNKTNEEGTECEICNDYSELINGICVNKVECAEEKNGECVKCNEKNHNNNLMCLNKVYGCVEYYYQNCLRCDDIFNLNNCTECIDGYEFDYFGNCIPKKLEF